jgi:hypothetical protein
MRGFEARFSRVKASPGLYTGMPKRKRQECDKCPRDGQNELQQKRKSRNNQKAQGRESAISLPMSKRCNP